MGKTEEIIITAILSTISALIVFYLSEKIKTIKNDRMMFKKLGMDLYEMLLLLMRFKSSCQQFIEINQHYSLEKIGSIGFPEYIFPTFKDNIPEIIYHNNGKILQDILQLNKISFSLNNLMKDLCINEIKEDLLSKRVSIEESKGRYAQEVIFLSEHLNNLSSYISLVKRLYANILLINSYEDCFDLIYLKINFNNDEINGAIKKVDSEINRNIKIDELLLDK